MELIEGGVVCGCGAWGVRGVGGGGVGVRVIRVGGGGGGGKWGGVWVGVDKGWSPHSKSEL